MIYGDPAPPPIGDVTKRGLRKSHRGDVQPLSKTGLYILDRSGYRQTSQTPLNASICIICCISESGARPSNSRISHDWGPASKSTEKRKYGRVWCHHIVVYFMWIVSLMLSILMLPTSSRSGAGVGVGMLRGAGASLTWKWRIYLIVVMPFYFVFVCLIISLLIVSFLLFYNINL